MNRYAYEAFCDATSESGRAIAAAMEESLQLRDLEYYEETVDGGGAYIDYLVVACCDVPPAWRMRYVGAMSRFMALAEKRAKECGMI